MLCFFFADGEIASNTETTGDVENDDWLHRNDSYEPVQIDKESIGTILVGAESDQQVNIYSFIVRCDRMWTSTQ